VPRCAGGKNRVGAVTRHACFDPGYNDADLLANGEVEHRRPDRPGILCRGQKSPCRIVIDGAGFENNQVCTKINGKGRQCFSICVTV
jgi:hypothetical protein